MTVVWIQSNQNTFYVYHIRVEVDLYLIYTVLHMRTVMLGSMKIAKLLNSKYNLQWNDYNLISRSLEMSSLIFIFRLDFWIVIHLWNRLYSSFYILGRAKPVPPPRSHSLEQHNYADHKKQPTTATGKDTKDKANAFQEVLRENPWRDTLYYDKQNN